MDATPKQEFRIRELPTRTVTLFPTRAQVVRDIKNVVLKPGANEIVILGLSPSVDEDSIKVEGTGSAIISDIAVELLPNRNIFQEIYPDSDDNASDNDDDLDAGEDRVPKKESEAITSIYEKITAVRDDLERASEEITSAAARLKILDAYGNSLDNPERKVDISDSLGTYRSEREKVFTAHMDATIRKRQLTTEVSKLEQERMRLLDLEQRKEKQANKAKAKEDKAKLKEAEKKRRREEEKRKEKLRVKRERESFWPRFCWSVRITLDALGTADTPSSSRRSSIGSASDLVKVVHDADTPSSQGSNPASYTCDLSVSYVVSNAYWSPSYDLSLSTTANTALLCFDAQLTNKTSENWSRCKVVLSTSQATFAGLQDAIPTLVPWRVRLGGRGFAAKNGDILNSREERVEKEGWKSQQSAWGAQKSRAHLYGAASAAPVTTGGLFGSSSNDSQAGSDVRTRFRGTKAGIAHTEGNPAEPRGSFLGATVRPATAVGASALFGGGPAQAPVPPPPGAPAPARSRNLFKRSSDDQDESDIEYEGEANIPDDDALTMREPDPELSFQETAFEEMGLTTTYDLPGLKTLNTSATASKQRVARVSFANVAFSHTVVAKYKPVAYLKAKLRNGSKLTLLRGPVGLTLDGTFMGRSTLPRCSAGDAFTLSLGIDPAIDVVYPKPDVKRSTSGIFTKEHSSVYTRSVTIANTRAAAGKPVSLVVLDQVPVSEDERLRIAITHPRGLAVGGEAVPTGVPGKHGKDQADWGRAVAQLKKAGEVSWDVSLNAGRSVKLALEYEVAAPGGEGVVQV